MIKQIAVLLTCHNRKIKTLGCLEALFESTLPKNYSIDVFLVDDGSTDGTSDAIRKKYPQVNIIKGNGSLFWNRGMRLAWEHSIKNKDYDYFFWLNDDTMLYQNSLFQMLTFSETKENKSILVGGTCSSSDGGLTYGGYVFPDKKITPRNDWQKCDFFNGNIVLIPSLVFKKVGLLDHHFHHSFGDIDYGMRASKMGFTHYLAPNFLGTCEKHEHLPLWRNPEVSISKRIKHMYSPLGNNPIESFKFEQRHNGISLAFLRFFSNHLRLLFPKMWHQQ